jgi:vacuolar-type H+-ATPase subunit E/Vma4
MGKEEVEKRMVELQNALKRVEAQGNALVGAIQECEYWLKKLEEPEQVESATIE